MMSTEAAHLQDKTPNGTNQFCTLESILLFKAIAHVHNFTQMDIPGVSGQRVGFLQ